MNLEETRAYIAYRLKRSGGRPELFTPDAVEMVFRLSRGIPRSINLTCDSALIYGFAEEELVINREVVAKAAKQLDLMGLVNIEDAAGAASGEASAPAVKCDGDGRTILDSIAGLEKNLAAFTANLKKELAKFGQQAGSATSAVTKLNEILKRRLLQANRGERKE